MNWMARIPALTLCVVLAWGVQAQIDPRRDDTLRRDLERPELVRPDEALVQLYWSLTDLSLEDQREQTWGLSSRTKAALWTFNVERYLRDHPELTTDAQEILREGLRLVNLPAWFDIVPGAFGYELKTSALEDFKHRLETLPPQMVHEVFIRLGAAPQLFPSPEDDSRSGLVPRVESQQCYCSGWWECAPTSSYRCYDAWCDPKQHCGVFGNETCFGICKSTGL